MKRITYLIAFVAITNFAFTQTEVSECVSCYHNSISFEKFASGIGYANVATGKQSFVGGTRSFATGDYSFAFGFDAKSDGKSSFSLGNNSQALGMYSVAIGRGSIASGDAAFALGYMNLAQTESSYLFGEFLKSTAGGSVTIGMGAGIGENYLTNNKANSLMVGFNSNVPTFFVSTSSGSGTTGKIGIGNITSPEAKLHILGDGGLFNENDASLFIQSSGNYYSTIWLGDTAHSIKAKPNSNLTFHTSTGDDFVFENGNVGIGISNPDYTLDVKGTTYLDYNCGNNAGNALILKSGDEQLKIVDVGDGDYGIIGNEADNTYIKAYSSDDSLGAAIFLNKYGNVGIGTDEPNAKLDVAGNIKVTGFQLDDNNQGNGKLL